MYHFYAVIIGTEILNGRRSDAHFPFVKSLLEQHGWSLHASLTIKDDPILIEETFKLILNDPEAILFCFGGIGSTPDDLTRAISAKVFTDQLLKRHKQFEQDIIDRFKEDAYPFRILMSDLPVDAQLLYNPVNNMSGYYLKERYFFVPGFPEMAHPMITQAVKTFFKTAPKGYRKTLFAHCSENDLNQLMHELPKSIELSSLPQLHNNTPSVTLSLASQNEEELILWFNKFVFFLDSQEIAFTIE